MSNNTDNACESDEQADSGRNIWKRLDLLMSQAERLTSEAHHSNPNSLLKALNYLWDLESAVQRELDFAVISLKEFWGYRSSDIAGALGTKWEHDRSHLLIAVPDNELGINWREAQTRYRDALKRQFGSDTEVPSIEYFSRFREDIYWRRQYIEAMDTSSLPPRPKANTSPRLERETAKSLRLQRVARKLIRAGILPPGIDVGTGYASDDAAGFIHLMLSSEDDRILESISIPPPADPRHPYEDIDILVTQIARRAQELRPEPDAGE